MMPVTEHNRDEWSRCAKAMYARGRNDLGHRMSVAATRRELPLPVFDCISILYRQWLVFDEPKS